MSEVNPITEENPSIEVLLKHGVDATTLGLLSDVGIDTIADLEPKEPAELKAIKGIGDKRVAEITAAWNSYLDQEDAPAAAWPAAPTAPTAVTDDAPKPNPKPHASPRARGPAERPKGCVWMRLRKGQNSTTTSAHDTHTNSRTTVRLLPGLLYAMPPGVVIGKSVSKAHPAVVIYSREESFAPLNIADIDVEAIRAHRAAVRDLIQLARADIMMHGDRRDWAEAKRQGLDEIVRMANVVRKAAGRQVIDIPAMNPAMPYGVISHNLDAKAHLSEDRLAHGLTGKLFDNEQDLEAYDARLRDGEVENLPADLSADIRQQIARSTF